MPLRDLDNFFSIVKNANCLREQVFDSKICICKVLNIWHSKIWNKEWGRNNRSGFVPFPPAVRQWWDAYRRERPGFGPGWWRVLPGVDGGKLYSILFAQEISTTSRLPSRGHFLSKPKFGSVWGPSPNPTPGCSANESTTHWWKSKQRKQLNTNNFLKPKNIFMELNIFWVFFFKCKSSDTLFQQKQHLGMNSGTWVLGDYRYASWIFLLILKASSFYSWVHTDTHWPSPLLDREGGQPASLVR